MTNPNQQTKSDGITITGADDLDLDLGLDLGMEDELNIEFVEESNPSPRGEEEEDGDGDGNDETARRLAEAEAERAAANERAAAAEAEVSKERKAKLETQVAFLESQETSIEAQIKDLTRQLADAEEEGNTADKLRIQDELADAKSLRTKARDAKRTFEGKLSNFDKDEEERRKKAITNDDGKKQADIEPEAKSWVERNAWFSNPRDDNEVLKRAMATTLYDKMLKEGKKPNSKSFYDEIDRRLQKMSPNKNNDGGNRRPRNAPAPNGEGNNRKPSNSVQLDASDRAVMSKLGLDWRDKEHVTEFARHKLEQQKNPASKDPTEPGVWRNPVKR